MNIYKWAWSRIGGRPWTYISRDTWHKFEGIWIICLIACGAVADYYLGLVNVLIGLGVFTVGFIFGHIFWGTLYVPDQQGK